MSKIALLQCLQPRSSKIAVIVLGNELAGDNAGFQREKFNNLRSNAVLTCAVGGGCEFLRNSFGSGTGNPWIPDLVTGNSESVNQRAVEYYRAFATVKIDQKPDQSQTQFKKALTLVAEEIRQKDLEVDMVVAVVSGGERFDHKMAAIDAMFWARSVLDLPLVLISESDLLYVVPAGVEQKLVLDSGLEGPSCGLLPFTGVTKVKTTGLKWNLDTGMPLKFGQLINSSNEIVAPIVSIKSDLPVLWSMSLKESEISSAAA